MSSRCRGVAAQFPVVAKLGRWLLGGTAALLIGAPAFAGLVSVERTLPISIIEGNDSALGGLVSFGTPMTLRFTFDSDHPSYVVAGGAEGSFGFKDGLTEASLTLGDFSWELKPDIQRTVLPNRGVYIGDKVVFGDVFNFSASTLPAPADSFYLVMSATFIFPVGTLNSWDSRTSFPTVTPLVIDLASIVHEADTDSALFRADVYPNGPSHFPAVPEPSLYALSGVIAVSLSALLRRKKDRLPVR